VVALHDPNGDMKAANLSAKLDGNVLISDRKGNSFSSAIASYDGKTGVLAIPQQFVAHLASLADKGKITTASSALAKEQLDGPIDMLGEQLEVQLDAQGNLLH